MKIILVRHGETEANYEGIMQGQGLNYPLNDKGIRQAQRLSQELKKTKIDVCFTSPLARTWQTAMILVGDRVEIKEDKRLIERNLGEFEGVKRDKYDPIKYWDYNLNNKDNGVEGVKEIFERCQNFLDNIYEKFPDSTVLIVSHMAVIRTLHHIISKSDLESNLLTFKIDNCYCKECEYNK